MPGATLEHAHVGNNEHRRGYVCTCFYVYVKMDKGKDVNLEERWHGKDGGEVMQLCFDFLITEISKSISVIILNTNGLNSPMKAIEKRPYSMKKSPEKSNLGVSFSFQLQVEAHHNKRVTVAELEGGNHIRSIARKQTKCMYAC